VYSSDQGDKSEFDSLMHKEEYEKLVAENPS